MQSKPVNVRFLVTSSIISVGVLLIFIEMGVRVLKLYPDRFTLYSPEVGWIYQPNLTGHFSNVLCLNDFNSDVVINSAGFHDIEHDWTTPKSAQRVVFLGDSFVAGLEVQLDQNIARLVQSQLDTTQPNGYQIINAGVTGFSTYNELLLYRHKVQAYQPDTVVLFFEPSNDLPENLLTTDNPIYDLMPRFTLEETGLVEHTPTRQPDYNNTEWRVFNVNSNPLYRFLHQTSDLYALLSDRITLVNAITTYNTTANSTDTSQQTFLPSYNLTQALLVQLRDEVEASGAQFWVVLNSNMHNTPNDLAVQHMFEALFIQNQINYLALHPYFHAENAPPSLRFPCDNHWTPAGHALVAPLIANLIVQQSSLNP